MSEQSAVQNSLIKYASEIGWEIVPPKQELAWRGSESGLYFTDLLREKLLSLNPGIVDPGRAKEIIRRSSCCGPASRATTRP